MTYVSFASINPYNWKLHNSPVLGRPSVLTGLLDSIMLTHLPTCNDCPKQLQVLFTTEERERIMGATQKFVLRAKELSTQVQADIHAAFPLTLPSWDFNTAEGQERLQIYHQTLMGEAYKRPPDGPQIYLR